MSTDPDILFFKAHITDVATAHKQHMMQEIQNLDGNRLLNTVTADLVTYFVSKYSFSLPELDLSNAQVDQGEGQVLVHDAWARMDGGDSVRSVTGTIVELTVPFSGDRDFFFIRPNTWNTAPPRAVVEQNALKIYVKGRNLAQQQVKSELDRTITDIQQYLDWQKSTAADLNKSLAELARSSIEDRKAKLLKDRELVAGLGFPIKKRENDARTYVAPEVRKKVEPRLPDASREAYKPEPVLDDAIYRDILATIENMTKVMERSPSAFSAMGEEDLRQHFLVQLNGRFEGAATGETFNHQGKTDILIRAQDRNIFIAECKFWRGEKAFTETINQILSYLSWRDTKAAIILFNRQKDFTNVLLKAQEAATSHPSRKRGPNVEGETRFRYVFGNPSDMNREIILSILAFNVPNPDKG